MKKNKKLLVIIIVFFLVMSLQFNVLTGSNKTNDFALSKIVKILFVNEVFARNPSDCPGDVIGCDGIIHCDPDGNCYIIWLTYWATRV